MNSKINNIIIPKENANDDTVKIAEWFFSNGDFVKKDDVILEIETSKATLDITSDFDGYIEILHKSGSEVEINEIIGHLHVDNSFLSGNNKSDVKLHEKDQKVETGNLNPGVMISRKARLLIEKHSIDPDVFAGIELIKENDVKHYIDKNKKNQDDEDNSQRFINEEIKNGLFSDLRSSSKLRKKNIMWVILNYIFRNWFLNLIVKISPVVIIIIIHRLRGVKIGKGCFIDPSAIIETAYPNDIMIGDDVRVAAGSIIMTHIKGPAKLRSEGMIPQVNKPVVLKDSCFIGVNCTIMPGVTVGKCAVVASGAVVLHDVPDYNMVSGNPAKSIKILKRSNQNI